MALPSCRCVGAYPNWKILGPIVAAARTWAGESPDLHCFDNRPIIDQLRGLYCATLTVSGGGGGGGATLLASFYIPEIVDSFERGMAAGYSGNGDLDTFQREAAVDILRGAHYQDGIDGQLVILEDEPTECVLAAPGVPFVTPGELEFSAVWVAIPVTVSLDRYEYRVDAGSWTTNGLSLTITDLPATAGMHTLSVRAISTSGVIGEVSMSDPFEVVNPPAPPADLLSWPMSDGSGTDITATVGPDGNTNCSWEVVGSGFALGFNGTNQSAITNSSIVFGSPAITVCGWVSADSWASATENSVWEVVPNYASGPAGFLFGFQANTINLIIGQSGGFRIQNFSAVTESLVDGTEYFIAVVYDNDANAGSGNMKAYIDGSSISAAVGVDTKAGTGNLGTAQVTLGARNQASAWFGGQIRDFRIYQGELTAEEIAAIYTAGPE